MKILVCDDDPPMRNIVTMVLKSLGHEMDVACDGQEAFEKIRAAPNFFDVLIADNLMPRLTGIELVAKLRALNIPIKVIMITGFPKQLNPEVRDRLRVDGLLFKPFRPAELLDCVKNLGYLTVPSHRGPA